MALLLGFVMIRSGLVIPAHNVEGPLAGVLRGARKWVEDILVVDDGSTDLTREAALAQGAQVLSWPSNRGKGRALKTGFGYYLDRGVEVIITMDGDGQHDPDCLPALIEAYHRSQAQVVIGSRLGDRERIPKIRYYPNLVGTYCVSWATGQYVPDSQSGLRLYQAQWLKGLPLKADGFALETEVLIKLAKKGAVIASIDVPALYPAGGAPSHYRPVADTYRISIMVLRSIFWPRLTKRPRGVFGLPFRQRKMAPP
jgi:glycosyltransferase involved in cell wall biosynthesis